MNRTHAWRWLSPALMALALSSCGTFMDPPVLDVPLPTAWEIQQQAEEAAANKPAPLAREWWKAANDPVLNGLMERIEKQNLSIEQSRFRLQAARTDIGGNHYLPTLSLNQGMSFEPVATFQERTTPGGVPTNARVNSKFGGYHKIGLDAQWEIPLFGSYSAAESLADAGIHYAEADIDAVRASVYAEAVTDYVQLRAAQQLVVALKKIEASQTRITKLLAIRVKIGLADTSEQMREAQTLLAMKNRVSEAENGVLEYKQRLARLEGTAIPDTALDATGPLVIFPPQQFSDTPLDVLRNRPDIRKAEQAVTAAASELKLAKNDRYPKLKLEGELFKYDNIVSRPIPYTSPGGSMAQGLILPLFDWGRLKAAADVKDAKLAETASSYRETVVTAITESQQALSSYQTAQAQRGGVKASYEQAKKLTAQAALLNSQGLTNQIAVETAQIAQQQAEIRSLGALSNESISLANLAKALGGGLTEKAGAERAKKE